MTSFCDGTEIAKGRPYPLDDGDRIPSVIDNNRVASDAGQEIMADDGAGTDADLDAARERGDRVTHTRGLLTDDIVDMTASGFGGHLVEVSRGSVVDGGVPLDALERGAIAGVGLDILAGGPRIGPRVAASEDVVLQPHHASGPVETRRAVGQLVRDTFAAHFGGRPLSTPAI